MTKNVYKPSIGVGIMLTALATPLFLVAGWIVFAIYGLRTGEENLVVGFQLLLPSLLIGLIVHELIHASALRALGHHPRFGVGLAAGFVPVAWCTTSERLSRNQFIVTGLAPLVVITVIGCAAVAIAPGLADDLLYIITFNAAGSVGDLWLVKQALRYPATAEVQDEKSGMTVYLAN